MLRSDKGTFHYLNEVALAAARKASEETGKDLKLRIEENETGLELKVTFLE